ncbi:endonuclease IV [Desulfotomaculum copahuensis]|uniref:Endonuclease IV n=2 Tax=Desulfotomaculum copahuensis TaxID=1838280 RepID=A0A1B7LFM4_9FIRM|nr:endonuclease IV [Desulfotomaculum copahuensis]
MRFGPAGNPPSFQTAGHKSSLDMPAWLRARGLNAYEYQCVRGVHIGEGTARQLGRLAAENDIRLSIHAPYYITLGTADDVLKEKTTGHLLKSMQAANWMDAAVVVFHPGTGAGEDRRETLQRAKKLLGEILQQAREMGLAQIKVAPETAGKPAQLGNLEEVLELCDCGPQVVPAIDFGHLHAASGGGFTGEEAFMAVLDRVEAHLGREAVRHLHIHFSPIEFTRAGEKRHRTTLEPGFGPDFALLARLLVKRELEPTIICESYDRQAEDALVFKQLYEEMKNADK